MRTQEHGARSTLPSHVTTRPPFPPFESEASEVASGEHVPGELNRAAWRALMSARPSRRMANPPRDSPADLETLRRCSGRPVCLPVCQLFYSLSEGTLSTDTLAYSWPQGLCKYASAPPWKIPLRRDLLFSQREGTLWHPHLDLWSLHVWSLDGKVLGVLLLAVVNTTTSARAPSTRQAVEEPVR